jgi:thiosulfate dehydrogenase [quinone] large subunit
MTPLTEVALGLVLVLGVVSMPAAVVSAGLLAVYWSSDQLIAQYPVMAVLSVGVVAGHAYSDRWSVIELVRRRSGRKAGSGES